jgi:tetratricopeptide (TPR) repeat protein
MASMTTIESPGRPIAPRIEEADPGADAGTRAIAALGSWMVALGAIRLVCAGIAYARAWGEAWTSGTIAALGWSEFFGENPPAAVLIGLWPLLLGLALFRTRWPELLKAGALTLLVLSLGGMLSALADWGQGSSRWITIGSFRVPRVTLGIPGASGRAAVLAGVAQWLVEMVTAAGAIRLVFRLPGGLGPGDDRDAVARRSRLGRLAVCVSIALLVLTVRVPSGSAVLELINHSQWIRDFILRDDFARLRGARQFARHESAWAQEVHSLLYQGQRAWEEGRYASSRDAYSRIAARLDAIPTATMTQADRGLAAQALNNSAWLLATCPEAKLRGPEEAVRHARRALELAPNDGATWNTLGVAYFRLGDWDEALSALYRSMELRNEGDSEDWFFLAMIHWRMGRKERARDWFDKAVKWSRIHPRADDELYRFEVEAAEALGLPKPERRPPQLVTAPSPLPMPMPQRGLRVRSLPRPAGGGSRPR